ncbi:MAG TPA: sulfotransferase [Pirellulales bacterium]|nr:sulfotransferase [Pirellulales bacterium]
MLARIYRRAARTMRPLWLKNRLAGRFDEQSVLVLTSSPRSGSTLLGQVLASIPGTCVLFEPLHLDRVPEAKAAGFSWRTYVEPDVSWPAGEEFLRRVFSGRVINKWTASEMTFREATRANKMIVKFVRANRLLPWMCQTFEMPAPILLIRHPCAVIASQLKYGWKNSKRSVAPPYVTECPLFKATLSKTGGDEENLAAYWALDQLPALMQSPPHPWTIVTYEELVLRPVPTLTRIVRRWNLEIDISAALSRLKIPSSMVSKSGISGVTGWKKDLSPFQIARILRITQAMGLQFYTAEEEADYSALYSQQLAEELRRAGTTEDGQNQVRRAA